MPSTGTLSGSQTPATPNKSKGKPVRKILLLLLLIGIAYFVWQNFNQPNNPHQLSVSGRLEGYETNLSPKIGGRISFIKYREGDPVKAGELVAQLNDEDYQSQLRGAIARIAKAKEMVNSQTDQLAVVQAQIEGAGKRVTQSREESSAQIDQAKAELQEAQAKYYQSKSDVEQAKSDLQLASIRLTRYTDLVKKGAVTKDEYDQASTTYTNSVAIVHSKEEAEQASLKAIQSAKAGLNQNRAARFTPPIRKSDLNAFQSQLDQARQQLRAAKEDVSNAEADRDQIQANINYLAIRSPISGVVTARPVEPGAVLAPGQTILTVIDYSQVYMRAYVPEGQIGSVKVGQKAEVYLDARPKAPMAARVIEIDPEGSFTPENIYFKNDRVKQVFGIKIGIDKPGGYAKPGMPADATIDL